jgi:cytochrome P450
MTIALDPATIRPVPDGPRGCPILGVLPRISRDPFRFLNQVSATYGDIIPMRLVLKDAFVLNHPDHVEHVLHANAAKATC